MKTKVIKFAALALGVIMLLGIGGTPVHAENERWGCQHLDYLGYAIQTTYLHSSDSGHQRQTTYENECLECGAHWQETKIINEAHCPKLDNPNECVCGYFFHH